MKYNTAEPLFKLVPEGTFKAKITDASEYNNPDGPNKLIVEFTFNDPETLEEIKKKEFIMPSIMEGDGFRVFADLIKLIKDDVGNEGEFNEQELIGVECMITTKHIQGRGKHEGKTFANLIKVEPLKKNM